MNNRTRLKIISMTGTIIILAGLSLITMPVQPASAADNVFVNVHGTGDCSQSHPCNLAYGLAAIHEGDTLYAAAGTYTRTGSQVVLLDKTINFFGGWNEAPTGTPYRDPDTQVSILDGENSRRVITITGSSSVRPVVDGWTIRNGNASGMTTNCHAHIGSGNGCGGGIYVYQAEPTITNNIIENNTALSGSDWGSGGGIYVGSSDHTLIRWNRIRNNDSAIDGEGWGGGIYVHDSFDKTAIMENEIYENEESSTLYKSHSGSGIQVYYAAITIFKNYIHDNNPNDQPYWGTGIATQYTDNSLIIDENMIVFNYGMSAVGISYSVPTISQNVIINPGSYNGLAFGGHLDMLPVQQYVQVTNNIIAYHLYHNVYINADNPHLARVNMVFNTLSHSEHGLYVDTDSDVTFDRGILSDHSESGIQVADDPLLNTTLVVSNSLFHGNTVDGLTGSNPFHGDPLYIDPAGGDFHIGSSSAAINRVTGGGVGVDIDDQIRPVGAGATPFDVGADEFLFRLFLPQILN